MTAVHLHPSHVAVLGAGIMGSSVALFLARRGFHVTLLDAANQPFSGASRWNEGKIHLGHLYAGDTSMQTARAVLAGGLAFKSLTEELIGCSLREATTPEDDIYLVHRESVASPEATARYYETVTELARNHPQSRDYLVDISQSRVRRLSRRELENIADTRTILAGFRVPERSVFTNWVADRFVDALDAEARIELRLGTRITGIQPAANSDGSWALEANPSIRRPFKFVVNALWHGRLAIDRAVGLNPEPGWSHRYRLSLFVRTAAPVQAPSAILATGPFGDIKNYTGQDFYLSWYDAGLLARGELILPPNLPPLDDLAEKEIAHSIVEHLGHLVPAAKQVAAAAVDMKVRGGWVFAAGRGSLADPHSTLHRRDHFGIRQLGSYLSVDTGKYSSAPFLAREVASRITAMAET